MTKIKNTEAYPIKKYPTPSDYVIGSDSEDNGKTVNFNLETIINMVDGLIDYKYSLSSLPITTPNGDGIFQSQGITDFSAITKFQISKITLGGQDLEAFYSYLTTNFTEYSIFLVSKTNRSIFGYYKIAGVAQIDDYFEFTVMLSSANSYLGVLEDKEIYSFEYNKVDDNNPLTVITQTITDGDTTHAPSGDAVFDALADIQAQIPTVFTKIVYFNSTNPATATIFDTNNPPVTNDNALKNNVNYLYIGNDSSTWVYKTSPAGYVTYTVTSGASNFYITGTNIDAGGVKTGSITKRGELVIDSEVSGVSGLKLLQGAAASASGTFSVLTLNNTTGAVEKVLNSSFLHTKGDETKEGYLTFSYPSGGVPSGIILANGHTTPKFSYGLDIRIVNAGGGIKIDQLDTNSGSPFSIRNQGTETLEITKLGNIISSGTATTNAFIKTGGTASQFLKADGSVDNAIYAVDSNVFHLTGDEIVSSGVKRFFVNGSAGTSYIQVNKPNSSASTTSAMSVYSTATVVGLYTNSINGSSNAGLVATTEPNATLANTSILATTNSLGTAITAANNSASTGTVVRIQNQGAGTASTGLEITSASNASGYSLLINNGTSNSTTQPISYKRNSSELFKVDYLGNNSANSFIKTGATVNDILLGDGTTMLNSGFLHTTGNETFDGIKSSTNNASTATNGITLVNNGASPSYVLRLTNTNVGTGFLFDNTGAGVGFSLNNSAAGFGFRIINSTTGIGQIVTNNGTGLGVQNTNVSSGVLATYNSQTGSTGDLIQFQKNSILTSKFDQNGRYSIAGGTSSQFLMADGSVNSGIFADNSAGAIQGFAVTNNGNGTVNIASGTAYLRAANDPYAPLVQYTIPAVTNLALTDNANNFILVDYNGGSPALTVTTNTATINTETNSLAIVISRVGTTLDYLSLVGQNVDANAKLRVRFLNQEGIRRANGAGLGFSARGLTLTAGVLFSGLIRINSPAFNTVSPDTFTQVYNNGAVWTRTAGQTQVNNTQYNNAGVLTNLGGGDFRTDYIYLLPNNPSKLYLVLGTASFPNITQARTAAPPSSLPSELQSLGLLVGRSIIQRLGASISEVSSAFDTVFPNNAVPEHNALSGLQGGAAGDYQHLTTAEKNLAINSIQGTGTINYIPIFTAARTIGNSSILQGANGSIGINGASAPDAGDTRIQSNGTTYSTLSLKSTLVDGIIRAHNPNGLLYLGTISNHGVGILANGNEAVRFAPDGTVGIGGVPQFGKLELVSSGAGTQSLVFFNAGTLNNRTFLQHITTASSSRFNFTSGWSSGGYTNWTFETGNVGIGTDNPAVNFDVRGKAIIANTDLVIGSIGSLIQIDQGGATSGNTYSRIGAYTNGGANSGNLILNEGGGNVGIGITSPQAKIHSYSDANTENIIDAPNGSSVFTMTSAAAGASFFGFSSKLAMGKVTGFGTSGFSEYFRIDTNGNVGINTTNPSEKLEVAGNIKTNGNIILTTGLGSFIDWNNGDARVGMITNGTSKDLYFGTYSTATAFSEKLRIGGNGNVLIGTTTDNGINKLQVNGTISTTGIAVPIASSSDLDALYTNQPDLSQIEVQGSSMTQAPSAGWLSVKSVKSNNATGQGYQQAIEPFTNKLYQRAYYGGWSAWVEK